MDVAIAVAGCIQSLADFNERPELLRNSAHPDAQSRAVIARQPSTKLALLQ
jgi:hypothetical protein